MLNRAINHYNSALTTAYNRIDALEAEVTHFQGELTRLPGENVASKAKVLEPPTFVGSENKMHLHDWLSQIAVWYLVLLRMTRKLCAPLLDYVLLPAHI